MLDKDLKHIHLRGRLEPSKQHECSWKTSTRFCENKDTWRYLFDRGGSTRNWLVSLLAADGAGSGPAAQPLFGHRAVNTWAYALWITATPSTVTRRGVRTHSAGNPIDGRVHLSEGFDLVESYITQKPEPLEEDPPMEEEKTQNEKQAHVTASAV